MFKLQKAPAMEKYSHTLSGLGFQVDDNTGEIRDMKGNFFEYFHHESEYLNDARKEAVHDAVRTYIAAELAKEHDIIPLHLDGSSSSGISTERPDKPHVTVLCTEPGKLKQKQDVVVVVGEAGGGSSGQDAGVWAYRSLMREGGVFKGSAVGLAMKLAERGAQMAMSGDVEGATPGVFILNPGQLLYSYKEGKAMTQTSWMGREKKDSLSEVYEVEDEWNKVEGKSLPSPSCFFPADSNSSPAHATSNDHIKNILKHVLPSLLGSNAKIHMVVMGDSVKATLDYLDYVFCHNPNDKNLVVKMSSIALIQPNHNHADIQSTQLCDFLQTRGRAWVDSEQPAGDLVRVPEGMKSPPIRAERMTVLVDDYDNIVDKKEVKADDEEDFEEVQLEVSCPTYSAGNLNGITELIFPTVIDDVLQFFWQYKASILLADAPAIEDPKESDRTKPPTRFQDSDIPHMEAVDWRMVMMVGMAAGMYQSVLSLAGAGMEG